MKHYIYCLFHTTTGPSQNGYVDIESLPAQSDYAEIDDETLSNIEYEPNEEEHPDATPDEEASVTHVSGQIAFLLTR